MEYGLLTISQTGLLGETDIMMSSAVAKVQVDSIINQVKKFKQEKEYASFAAWL